MEGGLDTDSLLDFVAFQISKSENRYDAFVYSEGRMERLVSGLLENLVLHLSAAGSSSSDALGDSFKLKLPESLCGSSWFTKSTVFRFLHIVGKPELLKAANAIENEMLQLEESRNFHLTLYSQGVKSHSGCRPVASNYLRGMESSLKPEVHAGSSDPTKNELLRAMDLRLTVLRDELASVFNRAAGALCCLEQIADLEAFSAHFGAVEMRDSLAKYLALCQKNPNDGPVMAQLTHSHDSNVNVGKLGAGVAKEDLPVDTVKHSRVGVSPAKIAQAERQSSTEGDNSSSSSDEETSTVERSRPLIRSASPRRSASPMRRIQIGRSGSRRSTALTIKSLNYFPARDRISANRDVAGNSSGDDETDQTAKKPENTVRRMSVQDAINLFESKQRDQKSDTQKWRSSIDMSNSCANKAVLRRWSAGMSTTQCLPEVSSEGGLQDTGDNSAAELLQKNIVDAKIESDLLAASPEPVDITEATSSGVADTEVPPLNESLADLPVAKADEVPDRATASAEWSRQKEAELNQMLMKMMESKPDRQRNTTIASNGNQEHSTDQRGGFYDHYKEKRDEKLRGENSRKRAEKEAHFKAMQEILDQRKAEISSKSKNVGIGKKQESASQSQKLRRSSSPSTQSKKELPKPAAVKKPSSKTTPLPATRKSWPSTPLPRSTGPQSNKIPSVNNSSGTTPTHRKPQPTPSQAKPSPKAHRSQPQRKVSKETKSENKQTVKGGEEKKNETATKSAKSAKAKAKAPKTPTDDPSAVPYKPSFYSKVTKKSSVVPLESKPFLKKGTGIGPGVGPGVVKAKTSQSDDFSKDSCNLTHPQENDAVATAMLETRAEVVPDAAEAQQSATEVVESEVLMQSSSECENTENSGKVSAEVDETLTKTEESSAQHALEEIEADEDSGISSAAWVEVEQQELPLCIDSGSSQLAIPDIIAPVSVSSPRVRHSLSQMLQADSGEPEIMEWGNAENPPAIVYQKDSPKGLKRFLKFARKSKGDANITGWASPSVFSEGEEDVDELKANGRRNGDALLRKSSHQVKGIGLQKTMLSESYDGGNSSKRDYTAAHELLSGPSGANVFMNQVSHKLHEGQTPTAAASTKASRSFFSLSTFRSSKSSEAKLR